MKGYLSLGDLGIFPGRYFGWAGNCVGEIVHFKSPFFSPAILTDPSYYKKIALVDTGPLDNRWPMPEEIQSFMPHIVAVIFLGTVQSVDNSSSSFTLENYLAANRIYGFVPDDPDTIRESLHDDSRLIGNLNRNSVKARDFSDRQINDNDLNINLITSPQEFLWDLESQEAISDKFNITVWDFGLNYGLMRTLRSYGCKLRVMPPSAEPEEIIALHPDGVVIAAGPISSSQLTELTPRIERIIGIKPMLGIGNGALILARALGAKVQHLKSSHYGASIFVENSRSGEIIPTYQAHSHAIDTESLLKNSGQILYRNISDNTVEGFISSEFSALGIMFPMTGESTPGYLSYFGKILESSMNPA